MRIPHINRWKDTQWTCNKTLYSVFATIVDTKSNHIYLYIALDLQEAVNNVIVVRVGVEVKQLVPFALFSSKKIFCTAVNNINTCI
jgi:hypothetical protein